MQGYNDALAIIKMITQKSPWCAGDTAGHSGDSDVMTFGGYLNVKSFLEMAMRAGKNK
jgi:hypothetical protein